MTAAVRCIPLAERVEWERALEGVPHGFGHTWQSCHAMQLATGHPTFLLCVETESARAVCPLVERTFSGHVDLATPSGFSGFSANAPMPELAEEFGKFARERGYVCAYVALNPLFEPRLSGFEPEPHNVLYLLDLTPEPEILLGRMDRNRRRQARAAERDAEALVVDRDRLTEFLVREHDRFLERVGAPASYRFGEASLRALCAADNTLLLGAGSGVDVEAVYLFGHTPYAGDCLLNVALPEGRRHAAGLLWSGALRLRAAGVPVLNLGGGVREDDSIAESKRRFGARRAPFRVVKPVFLRETFDRLCREAGADPEAEGGYFPPYRGH